MTSEERPLRQVSLDDLDLENQRFTSKEDIKPWLQELLLQNKGIHVVIERSDNSKVIFKCKNKEKKTKIIESKNKNTKIPIRRHTTCPFKIRANYSVRNKVWSLSVINDKHDHVVDQPLNSKLAYNQLDKSPIIITPSTAINGGLPTYNNNINNNNNYNKSNTTKSSPKESSSNSSGQSSDVSSVISNSGKPTTTATTSTDEDFKDSPPTSMSLMFFDDRSNSSSNSSSTSSKSKKRKVSPPKSNPTNTYNGNLKQSKNLNGKIEIPTPIKEDSIQYFNHQQQHGGSGTNGQEMTLLQNLQNSIRHQINTTIINNKLIDDNQKTQMFDSFMSQLILDYKNYFSLQFLNSLRQNVYEQTKKEEPPKYYQKPIQFPQELLQQQQQPQSQQRQLPQQNLQPHNQPQLPMQIQQPQQIPQPQSKPPSKYQNWLNPNNSQAAVAAAAAAANYNTSLDIPGINMSNFFQSNPNSNNSIQNQNQQQLPSFNSIQNILPVTTNQQQQQQIPPQNNFTNISPPLNIPPPLNNSASTLNPSHLLKSASSNSLLKSNSNSNSLLNSNFLLSNQLPNFYSNGADLQNEKDYTKW